MFDYCDLVIGNYPVGDLINSMHSISLFVFFFFFCATAAFSDGGVSVRTEKDTYAAGEPVTLVLFNESGRSIYSLAKSPAPGVAVRNLEVKNPRGIWDAFFLKSRKGADADFDTAGEIKPGEKVDFSWEPAVLVKNTETAPGTGLFRLSVIYHIPRSGKPPVFGTAKSNEFRIR